MFKGLFDRLRKEKVHPVYQKEKKDGLEVRFIHKGQSYRVEAFDLDFSQDVDSKSKPQGDTYGGLITLTISDEPKEFLFGWMMNTLDRQEGEIHFLNRSDKEAESVFLLSFKDAYCIRFQQKMVPQQSQVLTTLIISPRHLQVEKEVFENKWKRYNL